MKKINDRGFTLIETLTVTIFVAGVLIFLFIQFSNLNSSYEESFDYNGIEELYALEDIKNYIESDSTAYIYIMETLNNNNYIDISNCSVFTNQDYCKRLLELENIENIIVTPTLDDYDILINEIDTSTYGEEFKTFIKKINKNGKSSYRIIASFDNNTFATVRFGEKNE